MDKVLNKELAKLLNMYLNEKRFADGYFVRKAIDIIIDAYFLSDYIEETNIYACQDETDANLDFAKKEITIQLSRKIEDLETKKILEYNEDNITAYNIYVLKTILIEIYKLKHILEADRDGDIDSQLLYASFEFDLYKAFLEYKAKQGIYDFYKVSQFEKDDAATQLRRYHDYRFFIPGDRMSEIDANEKIYDIAEGVNFIDDTSAMDYYGYVIDRDLIRDYSMQSDEVLSPLAKFLLFKNKLAKTTLKLEDIQKRLKVIADTMDLKERLYMGLPIERQEYLNLVRNKKFNRSYAKLN